MILWIENNVEISVDVFIRDLKSNNKTHKLAGYFFFINLLKKLLKNFEFNSINDIIIYFNENSHRLNFPIFTSGTSSSPKEVIISLSNCLRYVKKTSVSDQKVWGLGYPVGSFASTQVFFQSFMNQQVIIYLFDYDFKSVEIALNKYRVTNLCCTPTFLTMISINMSSTNIFVKKITTGGEKMNNNLISEFKNSFINAEYINIYASTETGSLLYSDSEYFKIPSKHQNHIRIVNNTIHVHKFLLNDSSNIDLMNDWYDTKDEVVLNKNDSFKFKSRSKGYLNSGGYRISPSEIEEKIIKIPGVIDVHIFGRSSSILGTIICADIIGNNLEVKKIKSYLKSTLQRHKVPQIIKIVDSFKNISNGKKKILT